MRALKNVFAFRLTAGLFLMLAICPSNAQPVKARQMNWPQWRGPLFNGSSAEAGLPASFSKTQNVKWSTAMPGPSAATPIVWGERVFVSSVDQEKKTLLALCLDVKT